MRILLSGYSGAMGQATIACAKDWIVAGISAHAHEGYAFPTFTSWSEVQGTFDLVLEFSMAPAVDGAIDYALKHQCPLVIATTGLSAQTQDKIKAAEAHIAIMASGNFSQGIYAMRQLTKLANQLLADFDVELIEKHHNKKKDAPSGTAALLADSLDKPALIHSIRGGTIVGEHTVLFMGQDEVIELKHTALSKKIFAQGALKACEFLMDKPAGHYDLDDLY